MRIIKSADYFYNRNLLCIFGKIVAVILTDRVSTISKGITGGVGATAVS